MSKCPSPRHLRCTAGSEPVLGDCTFVQAAQALLQTVRGLVDVEDASVVPNSYIIKFKDGRYRKIPLVKFKMQVEGERYYATIYGSADKRNKRIVGALISVHARIDPCERKLYRRTKKPGWNAERTPKKRWFWKNDSAIQHVGRVLGVALRNHQQNPCTLRYPLYAVSAHMPHGGFCNAL